MGVDASVFPAPSEEQLDVHHVIVDDWAK